MKIGGTKIDAHDSSEAVARYGVDCGWKRRLKQGKWMKKLRARDYARCDRREQMTCTAEMI